MPAVDNKFSALYVRESRRLGAQYKGDERDIHRWKSRISATLHVLELPISG
ncbi:hypothetical protein OH492_19320 [Vibrio chagasii]|nr:hypothetical protein [Vibrio chagasii]